LAYDSALGTARDLSAPMRLWHGLRRQSKFQSRVNATISTIVMIVRPIRFPPVLASGSPESAVLAAKFEGIASGAGQANDGVQREHAAKLRMSPIEIMHVKLRAARSTPVRLPRDLR